MYKSFIETLELAGIVLPSWFFKVILVVIIVVGLCVFYKKYLKDAIQKIKKVKDDVVSIDSIKAKSEKAIDDMKKEIKNIKIQSDKGDEELATQIEQINTKLDTVVDIVNKMQEQHNKEEIAKAQDRLLELHKYYTAPERNGEWTEFEAEAFWNRYKSYCAAGGNDFIHEYVEPEMRKLKVIKVTVK